MNTAATYKRLTTTLLLNISLIPLLQKQISAIDAKTQQMPIFAMDDSILILTKIAQFGESPFKYANPFIHLAPEGRTNSFATEQSIGLIMNLFSLSVFQTQILIVFITVNLTFTCIYKLLRNYNNCALSIALISTLMYCLIYEPFYLRPISPGLNLAIFLFGLSLINSPPTSTSKLFKDSLILMPVIFLLSFSYFFYSVLLFAAYSLILAHAFVTRANILSAVMFGYALNFTAMIPFLVSSVFSNNVLKDDLNFRWGVVPSHFPGSFRTFLFSALGILVLIIYNIALPKLKFASAFFAAALLSNSQVVTGQSMEFDSHFFPVTLLFILIILTAMFLGALSRAPSKLRFFYPMLVSIVIFSLTSFVLIRTSEFINSKALSKELDLFAAVDDLVSLQKISRSKSISTPEYLADFVPLSTGLKTLYAPSGVTFFPMTNHELMERKVLNDFIQGNSKWYSVDDIISIFPKHTVNWQQKTRFERRFEILNVSKRDSMFRIKYEASIDFMRRYQIALENKTFLTEQIRKYEIGFALLEEYDDSRFNSNISCEKIQTAYNDFFFCTL